MFDCFGEEWVFVVLDFVGFDLVVVGEDVIVWFGEGWIVVD